MPMTVVVTTNAPMRVRGFLASCTCEICSGVYTAPRMTVAVRDRIWAVLSAWCLDGAGWSVVMTWPDPKEPGGQAVATLGIPLTNLQEVHGVHLSRRLSPRDRRGSSPPPPGLRGPSSEG
jgi:CRISPR-associated protein Cas2